MGKYNYAPEHCKPTKYKKVAKNRRLFPSSSNATIQLHTEETPATGESTKVVIKQPQSENNGVSDDMNDELCDMCDRVLDLVWVV